MRAALVAAATAGAALVAGCGGGDGLSYVRVRSCLVAHRAYLTPAPRRELGARAPVQHAVRVVFPFNPGLSATDGGYLVVTRDAAARDRFLRESLAAAARAFPTVPKVGIREFERDGLLIRQGGPAFLWSSVPRARTRRVIEGCLRAGGAS
jgi:hypothetical protein